MLNFKDIKPRESNDLQKSDQGGRIGRAVRDIYKRFGEIDKC